MKVDDDKVQVSGTIWFDKAARVFLGGNRIKMLEKIQALEQQPSCLDIL
jgi:hypothetical protein